MKIEVGLESDVELVVGLGLERKVRLIAKIGLEVSVRQVIKTARRVQKRLGNEIIDCPLTVGPSMPGIPNPGLVLTMLTNRDLLELYTLCDISLLEHVTGRPSINAFVAGIMGQWIAHFVEQAVL
jgi:hypothetical protein